MLSCFLLPSVRSVVIRGYSCTPYPNKVSLRSKMYKWGAAAAYCCARLLVARANRAVIVFALFRFVFLSQPFSAVVVVFASFVPQSAHTTTNHIKPKQEQSFISLNVPRTSTRFASFIPALALPTKKLHYTAKTYASPAFPT